MGVSTRFGRKVYFRHTSNQYHHMPTGYCMKCKEKREMKNTQEVTMKNGRKAIKGVCVKCGTKMFKIL